MTAMDILDPIAALIPAGTRQLRRSDLARLYEEATRLTEERERFFRTETLMADWRSELALAEAREKYVSSLTPEERANLEAEFADVLAWLCSLANLLDVDLQAAVEAKYGRGCPKCGQTNAGPFMYERTKKP